MILVGDIGGTNTRLALYERQGESLVARRRHDFRNDDFAGLSQVITAFLADHTKPEVACFGVAGLIVDGRCQMTNRDWLIGEQELSAQLKAPAHLINDVAAIAAGVVYLPVAGFAVLQAGARAWASGNVAVVAPGTGLGEGAAFWDGKRHLPFATEAGHADFAPVDAIELELAEFLDRRHGGHASFERVLSGPGIADIADFLVASRRFPAAPELAATAVADRPSAIVHMATAKGDAMALEALGIFLNALARETGNAALRYLALGGVALAGGIPPRLLDLLQRPAFLKTLSDKGRFSDMLRSLPIRVVIDDDASLLGSAHVAANFAASS